MAEIVEPLLRRRIAGDEEEKASEVEEPENSSSSTVTEIKAARLASLDVFRGLCVFVILLFFFPV